jgi:hypothetical protein
VELQHLAKFYTHNVWQGIFAKTLSEISLHPLFEHAITPCHCFSEFHNHLIPDCKQVKV